MNIDIFIFGASWSDQNFYEKMDFTKTEIYTLEVIGYLMKEKLYAKSSNSHFIIYCWFAIYQRQTV